MLSTVISSVKYLSDENTQKNTKDMVVKHDLVYLGVPEIFDHATEVNIINNDLDSKSSERKRDADESRKRINGYYKIKGIKRIIKIIKNDDCGRR